MTDTREKWTWIFLFLRMVICFFWYFAGHWWALDVHWIVLFRCHHWSICFLQIFKITEYQLEKWISRYQTFERMEYSFVWPEGILNAYIAMIPKVDGDGTPLGQTLCSPSCMSFLGYSYHAARRLDLILVSESVKCAGRGRSSVEAWDITALEIEESLSGAGDTHVHLFVADVVKSFDTVDREIFGSGTQ